MAYVHIQMAYKFLWVTSGWPLFISKWFLRYQNVLFNIRIWPVVFVSNIRMVWSVSGCVQWCLWVISGYLVSYLDVSKYFCVWYPDGFFMHSDRSSWYLDVLFHIWMSPSSFKISYPNGSCSIPMPSWDIQMIWIISGYLSSYLNTSSRYPNSLSIVFPVYSDEPLTHLDVSLHIRIVPLRSKCVF